MGGPCLGDIDTCVFAAPGQYPSSLQVRCKGYINNQATRYCDSLLDIKARHRWPDPSTEIHRSEIDLTNLSVPAYGTSSTALACSQMTIHVGGHFGAERIVLAFPASLSHAPRQMPSPAIVLRQTVPGPAPAAPFQRLLRLMLPLCVSRPQNSYTTGNNLTCGTKSATIRTPITPLGVFTN